MIYCKECGLWHGNSKAYHERPTPTVGPLSNRDLPEFWSWIYFHGKAEDHCQKYQDDLIQAGELDDWQAPDLVKASIPIEHLEDSRWHRVNFVDGLEMLLVVWSAEVEYKQDHETGYFKFHARRRGLICLYDDEEAQDYAFQCFAERRPHL